MKKMILTCFYLILTAVISAAGFLLPSILSDYQDKQIFAKIEHAAMEPMELTYSSSLFDTLQLLSAEHYYVNYPATGSSRTADEVFEIATDIVAQMENYFSIPQDAITDYTTTLQLAIASDEHRSYATTTIDKPGIFDSTSAHSAIEQNALEASTDITTAVIWSCSFYYERGFWITITIDDKSGKAVAFTLYTEQSIEAVYDKQDLDTLIHTTIAFVQDYFEMKTKLLQQSMNEVHSVYEKQPSILNASYTIQLKDESGKTLQIPLVLYPEYMSFNE